MTLAIQPPSESRQIRRCYSLSAAPGQSTLRISVKREPEGVASRFLHDEVEAGDLIQVGPPAGDFHLDPASARPLVLVAGGVGLTPFLSMLESCAERQPQRQVFLIYATQEAAAVVQARRLVELAAPHRQISLCYSKPGDREQELLSVNAGHVSHFCRRIDVDWLLDERLPNGVSEEADFYVCGPPALMDEVLHDLHQRGIDPERTHAEAFGGKPAPRPAAAGAAEGPSHEITLKRSGKTLTWTPEHPDLLSLLDAEGVESVQAGCWRGSCHSCKTALLEGEVEVTSQPANPPAPGHVLPCVCVPCGDLVLDA